MSCSAEAGIRCQPTEWARIGDEWRIVNWQNPDLFELVCTACGDDLGPYDQQSQEIRVLRGPYTQADARAALLRHI